MKREEYNEYRSRAADVREWNKACTKPIEIYIPAQASVEFKLKCLQLYSKSPLNCFITDIKQHPFEPEKYGKCLILTPYSTYEQYLACTTAENLYRFYIEAHE